MHVHDLQPFKWAEFNLTHHITRLSFGNDYPGLVNPLDGVAKVEGIPSFSLFLTLNCP